MLLLTVNFLLSKYRAGQPQAKKPKLTLMQFKSGIHTRNHKSRIYIILL